MSTTANRMFRDIIIKKEEVVFIVVGRLYVDWGKWDLKVYCVCILGHLVGGPFDPKQEGSLRKLERPRGVKRAGSRL